jgi:hypothetical protein
MMMNRNVQEEEPTSIVCDSKDEKLRELSSLALKQLLQWDPAQYSTVQCSTVKSTVVSRCYDV